MEMFDVQSSHIKSIGFDAPTGSMMVIYKGDREYHFKDVSADDFEGLKSAESPGRFLRQMNITGVKVEKKEEGE